MRSSIFLMVFSVLAWFVLVPIQPAQAAGPAFFDLHQDKVPNFAQNPTIKSVQHGSWSNTSTWDLSRLPKPGDVVLINHQVTYDSTIGESDTIGIEAGGVMRFKTDQHTKLKVGTLLVMPGGTLEVGTETKPIPESFTAEIIIKDKPLDLTDDGKGIYDPQQFGTSLLVINGKITMHGAPKTPTFVRLSKEPIAGTSTLSLKQSANGWRPGDRVILPGTPQSGSNPQWEELTVTSISSDGKTVNVTVPLKYTHKGAYDSNGTLRFLPHVGNISRNVIIRSENPSGVRGHTMAFHRADVDIRYVLFRDLGRTKIDSIDNTDFDSSGNVTHIGTNHIARYPVHTHHLIGPQTSPPNGYQFTLIGNAIDGGSVDHRFKWGMTIHGSHYGLIRQNVVYNMSGSGIAFEDGSESYNVLEENFVVRVFGEGDRADRHGGGKLLGSQGTGIWFHGVNNYVRNNVVANVNNRLNTFGYVIFNRSSSVQSNVLPAFKGADPHHDGKTTNLHALPILEFSGNEAYGNLRSGMTVWDVGASHNDIYTQTPQSVIKDLKIWNFYSQGFWNYQINNVVIDGMIVLGGKEGIFLQDYLQRNLVIKNADIQGSRVGIKVPVDFEDQNPLFTIENSFLSNQTNIGVTFLWNCCVKDVHARKIVIKNVKYQPFQNYPFRTISMDWISDAELSYRDADLIEKTEVFVENYNQQPGFNFQVFYEEQAPNFIVPKSSGNLNGSPEANLTNKQNWSKYGIAISGAVSPCLDNTTYPEITGFVCQSTSGGDIIPPLAPVGLIVN